ncbi:MAG: MFS transporter [Anaerolineae bacterium]
MYPPSFFLAMLANLLFFASMHLLLTPLPLYVKEIGGQPSQIGLVMGVFALTAILARPTGGRLVDTWGRKRTLLLGATIFILSPLLYTRSRSVPSLLLSRMFHGLGLSCFTTAYIVLVADLVPPSRRGEAIGVAGISTPISLMMAPALGAALLDLLGFRPLFLGAALMATLSWLILLFVQEPRGEDDGYTRGRSGLITVLRQRGVWVPSLAAGLAAITYGSLITFLPLFATERAIGNVGLFFTAYAVATIAVSWIVGRLSDLVGRRNVIIPSLIALALIFWLLTRVQELTGLMGVGLLYGVGFGSARLALNALVMDEAPLEVRGAAASVLFASFDLGIGVGSFLMGLVADAVGYGGMYGVVGGICLVGAALFTALMRQ